MRSYRASCHYECDVCGVVIDRRDVIINDAGFFCEEHA